MIQTRLHATALASALSMALSALGCTKSEPPVVIMISPEGAAAASPLVVEAPAAPPAAPLPVASASSEGQAATAGASTAPVATASAPRVAGSAKPNPKPRSISVEGRPFLVDDVARVASLGNGSGWHDVVDFTEGAMTTSSQRAALIDHFTQWSLAEHASIASFARFGLQLLGLGAPSHLLAQTTAAMQDEIRHARFGFGVLASLGSATGPQALAVDGALDGEPSLDRVLRLCVREGMIGETLAALELMASADLTSLPRFKERLTSIAADEARHAQLAYAFAAWAVQRDPSLMDVIDEEIAAWQCGSAPTAEGLELWGIIGAADRRAIQRDGFEWVVRPLVEQLGATVAGARTATSLPTPAASLA